MTTGAYLGGGTEILEHDKEMAKLAAPISVENRKKFLKQPESVQKLILAIISPKSRTKHFAFDSHILDLTQESRGLMDEDSRREFLQKKYEFEVRAIRKARADATAERL